MSDPAPVQERLERFRAYLHFLADLQMGRHLRGKCDPSDIVQMALAEAHQSPQSFQDRDDQEVMAWLRRALAHRIYDATKAFQRDKRNVDRERSLEAAIEASSVNLKAWLVADQSTPSQNVQRAEDELRLAGALTQLPEDQRDALVLHHCQGWTFSRIAEHLGCSPATVSRLLHRGGQRLRGILQADS